MNVSIKVVVGIQLMLVPLAALILSSLPIAFHVHNDVMDFVTHTATGVADLAECVLEVKLRSVQTFGDTLYKAATSNDLFHDLEPWQLVLWAGKTVITDNFGVVMFRPDNKGFVLSAVNAVQGGPPLADHVFVANLTNPGLSLSTGFFNVYTYKPANATQPWTSTYSNVRYSTQPLGALLVAPGRPLKMDWLGVTALQLTATSSLALLSYGAPLIVGGNASSKQYLTVSYRSSALSDEMKAMPISTTGAMVLFDLVSGAFIAGTVADNATKASVAAGIVHPLAQFRPTPLVLKRLDELLDPRVAPLLHARYTTSPEAAMEVDWFTDPTVADALAGTGLSAIVACVAPCTFVYWPHSNTLQDGPTTALFDLDVLWHDFVVVRVLDIGMGSNTTLINASTAAVSLRLIVTVPSADVVDNYVNAMRMGFLTSLFVIVGLSVASIAVVALVFRSLTALELDILEMAWVFLVSPTSGASTTIAMQSRRAERVASSSYFSEFHQIFRAIGRLSRALHTLRAFAPSTAIDADRGAVSSSATSVGSRVDFSASSPVAVAALSTSPTSASILATEMPYVSPKKIHLGESSSMWRVPVTTMVVTLDPNSEQPSDPMIVYNQHRGILEALLKHVVKCPGAAVDHFNGNRFTIHFNAAGRTPRHVLSAVTVALEFLHDVDMTNARVSPSTSAGGVSFGISSSISLCGYLGPPCLKVFTVVSPNVMQSSVMARFALQLMKAPVAATPAAAVTTPQRHPPLLLTWRAVEVAQQEQQMLLASASVVKHNTAAAALPLHVNKAAARCGFKPVVKLSLPGEHSSVPPYAYAVSQLHT